MIGEYFYSGEMGTEQFNFYRIPKALFTEPTYGGLSVEGKVLYGFLLERMGVSDRNKWSDDKKRIFIYFTLDEATKILGCGHTKAGKKFEELEKFNLIERKRQGQGKPTKIYVKKFVHSSDFQKQKRRLPENRSQDFSKTATNNTDISNTNINNTDLSINLSYDKKERENKIDKTELIKKYTDIVKENIDYDVLLCNHNKENIDGIVDLIVETLSSSKNMINISKDDFPRETVKNRLLKLDMNHIEYVLTCLSKTTTQIHNVRNYLLTALFRAPTTIESYYTYLFNYNNNKIIGNKELKENAIL